MGNQKGISIITLLVTIIVMIILAAIVINSSFKDTMDNTLFTRKVSEMSEVYDAVVQRGIEYRLDGTMYPYVGERLSDEDYRQTEDGIRYGAGFYYIANDDEEAKAALGLDRLLGNYLVNYDTGEVVSMEKVQYEGKDYYKLSDIASSVKNGSITTSGGEYDEDKGVNAPILSEGMVPVKEENGLWVATSEYDDDWYDYSEGKYATIMLMDELTLSTATNTQLRNMTRTDLNTLTSDNIEDTVVVQGSTFIWVPRYTYKEGTGDIVYSHLTEDYTEEGYVKSSAFYYGGYNGATSDVSPNSGYVGGGKELTGIWVSKYEAGYNQ